MDELKRAVTYGTGKPGAQLYLFHLELAFGNDAPHEDIKSKIAEHTRDWPEGIYTVTDNGIEFGGMPIGEYLKLNK